MDFNKTLTIIVITTTGITAIPIHVSVLLRFFLYFECAKEKHFCIYWYPTTTKETITAPQSHNYKTFYYYSEGLILCTYIFCSCGHVYCVFLQSMVIYMMYSLLFIPIVQFDSSLYRLRPRHMACNYGISKKN